MDVFWFIPLGQKGQKGQNRVGRIILVDPVLFLQYRKPPHEYYAEAGSSNPGEVFEEDSETCGGVIYIHEGVADDVTRLPAFYDETFSYLKAVGIQEIW